MVGERSAVSHSHAADDPIVKNRHVHRNGIASVFHRVAAGDTNLPCPVPESDQPGCVFLVQRPVADVSESGQIGVIFHFDCFIRYFRADGSDHCIVDGSRCRIIIIALFFRKDHSHFKRPFLKFKLYLFAVQYFHIRLDSRRRIEAAAGP